MRGIGHTLSRLPAVRVLFAGAALLAGATASAAFAGGKGGNDQTAMAIPRIGAPDQGGATAALPRPLTPAEAAQVRRIFAEQNAGRMGEAAALTARLTSDLLLGSILADRYLGRYHHSTVPELSAWLVRFGAQPEAPAIRALLLRRLPAGRTLSPRLRDVMIAPAPARLAPDGSQDAPPAGAPEGDPAPSIRPGAPRLQRAVMAHVKAGTYDAALRVIAHARGLRPAASAALRAEVARGLFAANRDAAALRVAAAARRSAPGAAGGASAAFIAGLASWRLDKIRDAAFFFSAAARARGEPPACAPPARTGPDGWRCAAAIRERPRHGSAAPPKSARPSTV